MTRSTQHNSINRGEYDVDILGSVLQYSKGFKLCRAKAVISNLMLRWKSFSIPELLYLNLSALDQGQVENVSIASQIVYNQVLLNEVENYLAKRLLPEVYSTIRTAKTIVKIRLAKKLYLLNLVNWANRGCGVSGSLNYGVWCGVCYDCKMFDSELRGVVSVKGQFKMIAQALLNLENELPEIIVKSMNLSNSNDEFKVLCLNYFKDAPYEYPEKKYGSNQFSPVFDSTTDNMIAIVNIQIAIGRPDRAQIVADILDHSGSWSNPITFLTTAIEVANLYPKVLVWAILRCIVYFVWGDVADYGYFIKTPCQTSNGKLLAAFEYWGTKTKCKFYDGTTLSVPTHFTIERAMESDLRDSLKKKGTILKDDSPDLSREERWDIIDELTEEYSSRQEEWLVDPILKIFPELRGSI